MDTLIFSKIGNHGFLGRVWENINILFCVVCQRLCGMGCGGDMKRVYEFDFAILEDETGGYIAFVPSLPGCHTQGESIDEVLKNIERL